MLSKIKNLFLNKIDVKAAKAPEEVSEKRLAIAICALLVEVAAFDGDFHEDEKKVIIELVKDNFDMSSEEAKELIALSDAELKKSIDLWQFTKLINQGYSKDERIHLLEMLWEVVYADGRLHGHEDFLIHKLATLLNLEHKDLIGAKITVRESGN